MKRALQFDNPTNTTTDVAVALVTPQIYASPETT
jgi:hypothetical protein